MNEAEFRKPTFDLEDTVPVTLGDNTEWRFPRIWFSLRPRFSGGRATAMKLTSSAGTEFDALKQAVEDAPGDEGGDWTLAAANLAAYLLSLNYDLTDEQLQELLVFPTTGEHAFALFRTIMAVASGTADPKAPTTSGSDAPS